MNRPADDDAEDIAAEELAALLRGPRGAAVAAALVGCRCQRDDPRLVAHGCVVLSAAQRRACEAAIAPDLRERRDRSRHSGRTIEALKRTAPVLARGAGLAAGERRALLIQPAAVHMDRFEQTGEGELLNEAGRCADRSWAIERGDHRRALYRREGSPKK